MRTKSAKVPHSFVIHAVTQRNLRFGKYRQGSLATRNSGFTLLEVVVALAVVALALSAIIQTTSGSIANQTYLRDRTFAHWVANNALTEWQVTKGWPDTGESYGTAEFGSRDWYWRIDVTQTEEEQMRRLDVEVRLDEDDASALATLSGFVKKPK